jgi:DNA-binding SARP family transcriptional activator
VFFGYLGPLLVEAGDDGAVLPTPRPRTFLAVLLTRAGRPVAVDELAEFVWDGNPPDRAADTLRTYAMRLRRALGGAGERIVTRDPGYLIDVTAEEVDALRFARAYREGAAAYRAGEWVAARAALADALALWRGEPLADIPSQLLRDAEVPSLHRQRLQALQWRVDADLQLGGGEELLAELEALTAREPLREQLHVLLMTALARAGQTSEALSVYQRARDLLISQLGIEPGPELRELQRRILAGDEIGPRVHAAVRGPVPHQLPAAAMHFTGRAAELKELDATLDHAATVTISSIGGMAGIGKTTLALHWAHQVADRFPDGQLYVNLRGFGPAAPMDPADALRGLLDALREPGKPPPPDADAQEALYRSLTAGRRLLIVLDNARDEQQVRPLIPGSASCLTLITSRNQLPGLVATNGALPVNLALFTQVEARELLRRRLGPERLSAEPAAVDQFVASCAGLPLALSIAAARAALVPGLPLTALSAQLSEPGLDALAGTDPYADLRSVFSWSYRQLSPEAAHLFRCLPLFPGPDISAEAARSIVRADGLLGELTRTHLLEEHMPGRFRLHDLLARYAKECSARTDTAQTRREVSERLLAWYAAAAAAAARIVMPRPSIPGFPQPEPALAGLTTSVEALGWLETERRNLVLAVEIAARLGIDAIAAKLPVALWNLFELHAHWQDNLDTHLVGIRAARRLDDLDTEAYLCCGLSMAYNSLGQPELGIAPLRRALGIRQSQGDLPGQAAVHGDLSTMFLAMGMATEATSECEESARLAHESGDLRGEGRALNNLGWIYQSLAEPGKALRSYLAARTIAVKLSLTNFSGVVEANLAQVYLQLNRIDDAIATATAAIELNGRSGNTAEVANAHGVIGDALYSTGDEAQARSHWRIALAGYLALGDPRADDLAAKLT